MAVKRAYRFGMGRPRADEVISPLAQRSDNDRRIPVSVDPDTMVALEEIARSYWMPISTACRVLLKVAGEVGPNGVIDLKEVRERLEADRERLQREREVADAQAAKMKEKEKAKEKKNQ